MRRTSIVLPTILAPILGLAVLVLAAAPASAQVTITYIQGAYAVPQTPQTTVTVPYAGAQTAGDFNVVVIGWMDATSHVATVSDTGGNLYVPALAPTVQPGVQSQVIYYAANIAAAAANANVVTVTFDAAATYPDIRIAQYRGIDPAAPVDIAGGASGTGTMSSSGTLTTTNPNDLLLGANNLQAHTTGPGAGYTQRLLTSPDGNILEDRVVTAAGSYSATAPISGAGWVMQLVAFRAAGGGPVAPTLTSLAPTSGPVGAAVTITGSNFGATQGTSTVKFNGTTAPPTSWSATSLVVPVPAGATTGTVVVTVGGLASNALPFTVTASAPTLTSLAPTSGPVGTAVTITGTSFGATQGTSTVKFNGTTAPPTSWSATSLIVPVPAGATTGNVVVTVGGLASNALPFTVTASAPTLTSLAPTSGPVGTAVTITGSNFGASQGTSTVTFNGTAATPTSWSASSLVVPVPVGATTGNVVVTVGGLASNALPFTVTAAATITYIQGAYAVPQTPQTTVTVPYAGAQTAGDFNVVVIGWMDATSHVATVSDTAGNLYVPALAPTVQPGVQSQVIYYAANIAAAANANVVTVTFDAAATYPDVRIAQYRGIDPATPVDIAGGASGTGTMSSSGTLTTTNPNDLLLGANNLQAHTTGPGAGYTQRLLTSPDGNILEDRIVTAAGSYSATAPISGAGWVMQLVAFRAASGGPVAPTLTSLAPTSGPIGTAVTITGSNFGATQGTSTVKFNGTTATPTSWSATSLVVPVPSGATTGNVVVTVNSVASNGVSFTVTVPPSITGLSPTSGQVGTSVTITGANFGATQGGSTVGFNGTIATPASWSATSIVVPVPGGATTGNVVVTVGGAASNAMAFTVTATAPSVTSLTPSSGPVGTAVAIAGANFGSTQGTSTVTFNGTTATPTSWSATSITVPVPAGATTGSVIVTVGGVASSGQMFTVTTPATISLVQHVDVDAGSTASATTAFPAANESGNFIALAIRAGGPDQTFTISDTRGNVYRQAARFNNNSDNTVALYYAENVGSGTNTVTITMPTAATLRFSLFEYRGIAASNSLDGVHTAAGTGVSPNSGTVTTTANGDLLIGVVSTGEIANFTPGSGFAVEGAVPALPGAKLVVEDAVLATAGTLAATGTISASDQWGAAMAAFKGAVAGTGTVPSITSLSPASGAVGTAVTITGSSFGSTQGTSTVTFNGTTATPTSWSATSIVVPVPAGATSGSVIVTAGSLASNSLTFTVTPPPSITNLSPTFGSVGMSVTITGTNFGATQGTSTVKFNGTTATPTSWSATSLVAPVPAGATTGNVVVTVNNLASNGAPFTVQPPPTGTGDVRRSTDFDGDGRTDITIYRPVDGTWYTLTSQSGYAAQTATSWGTSTDLPVPGDYDGDGKTDPAFFRPSTGEWKILKSSTNFTTSVTMTLGMRGDVPVPGDYDGDGKTDPAVFHAAAAEWKILKSTTGVTTTTVFGTWTDIPVPGDYDGDSKTDLAVWNPTAAQPWRILKSTTQTQITATLGVTGDIPVPGDYDGDGKVDVAVYHAATSQWQILKSSNQAQMTVTLGAATDVPVPGDYDGDGKVDPAIFRPSTGQWLIATSSTNYATSINQMFGDLIDVPAARTTRLIQPVIASISPTSEVTGNVVTISGTRFGATPGASIVAFNGVEADPSTWSATSIKVRVPSGATTGPVVVTVNDVESNGVTFTFLSAPGMTSTFCTRHFMAAVPGTWQSAPWQAGECTNGLPPAGWVSLGQAQNYPTGISARAMCTAGAGAVGAAYSDPSWLAGNTELNLNCLYVAPASQPQPSPGITICSYTFNEFLVQQWRTRNWAPADCSHGLPDPGAAWTGQSDYPAGMIDCTSTGGSYYNAGNLSGESATRVTCAYTRMSSQTNPHFTLCQTGQLANHAGWFNPDGSFMHTWVSTDCTNGVPRPGAFGLGVPTNSDGTLEGGWCGPNGGQHYNASSYAQPGRMRCLYENHETSPIQLPDPCGWSVNPSSVEFPAEGGYGFFQVTALPGCHWTATTNAFWTFPQTPEYTGSGVQQFAVDRNDTGLERTGQIQFYGDGGAYFTFTVTQGPYFLLNPGEIYIWNAGIQPPPFGPPPTGVPAGTIVYYHTDAIGSVRMTTNDAQQETRFDFTPFGEPVTVGSPSEVRQFAGKEHDATGFDYFGARYYSNLFGGRFTTPDPVVDTERAPVDPQLWARYPYVRNNPLRFEDPNGRQAVLAVDEQRTQSNQRARAWIASWFESGSWVGQAVDTLVGTFLPVTPKEQRDNLELSLFGIAGGFEAEGVAASKAMFGGEVQFHHSWPKYLGGAADQILEPLPKAVHDAFHSGLDKILPRQLGKRFYEKLSAAELKQLLTDLEAYTKAFDTKYGTQLYDAMIRAGFPIS